MKRSRLKRYTPLRSRKRLEQKSQLRQRRRVNPLSAAERAAREEFAGGGPCVVCPAEGGVCSGPVQSHHAVDKALLKKRGLRAHLWDVRNRVRVCADRHESHTNRSRPIPLELLPPSVFEFARELGLSDLLARRHPPAHVTLRSGARVVPTRPAESEAAA